MEDKRYDGLDLLRAFSMVSVVFMHAVGNSLYTRPGDGSWIAGNLLMPLVFTAVPCFFLMSGALLLGRPGEIVCGPFYRRRLPRIALPLLVWSLLTLGPGLQDCAGFADLLKTVRGVWEGPVITPLWFLYTLLPLYVLTPFLKPAVDHLSAGGRRWLAGLIAGLNAWQTLLVLVPGRLAGWMNVDLLNQLFLYEGYLGTFLLGALLRGWENAPSRRRLVVVFLALEAFIFAATAVWSIRAGRYVSTFHGQKLFFVGALSVCLFLLCRDLELPGRWKTPVRWISRLSFGVYLCHGLMLRMLHPHIPMEPGWRLGTVLFLAAVPACLLLTFVLASIRPLCFLFTGIPWETACRTCNLRWLLSKGKSAD